MLPALCKSTATVSESMLFNCIKEFAYWKNSLKKHKRWTLLFATQPLSLDDASLFSFLQEANCQLVLVFDNSCGTLFYYCNYSAITTTSFSSKDIPFNVPKQTMKQKLSLVTFQFEYNWHNTEQLFFSNFFNVTSNEIDNNVFYKLKTRVLLRQLNILFTARPQNIILPSEYCKRDHVLEYALLHLGISKSQIKCQCKRFQAPFCNPRVFEYLNQTNINFCKLLNNCLLKPFTTLQDYSLRLHISTPIQNVWHPTNYVHQILDWHFEENGVLSTDYTNYQYISQWLAHIKWKDSLVDLYKLASMQLLNELQRLNYAETNSSLASNAIDYYHDVFWCIPCISIIRIDICCCGRILNDCATSHASSKERCIVSLEVNTIANLQFVL